VDLAPHLPSWEQLADSALYGEWFASPQWVIPWLDAFGNSDRLAIQFVYDGARLAGVVPLVLADVAARGCAPTHVFPVNNHVRRVGALSAIPMADLLTAVFDQAKRSGRLTCWGLPQIPAGGEFQQALDAALRRTRLLEFSIEESRSAVADFDGGWEAYTQTLNPKLILKIQQKHRKIDRAGGWTFRIISDPADWTAGWSDVLSIEARSWKHAAHTSIVNEPGTATFYEGVGARTVAAGMLRLHVAAHQGIPVAHVLGVVSRGTYYLLKHSFAEEYKPSSAGTVLMWNAMAEAAASGCQRFDFLGDAMDWKLELSTSSPEYRSSTVFPATNLQCLGCRVRERTLKPVARRLGLPSVIRSLRRVIG
jgi:CelD/BcsL family acetyltransferase involved in cellulose biosynthesis